MTVTILFFKGRATQHLAQVAALEVIGTAVVVTYRNGTMDEYGDVMRLTVGE